MNILTLLAQYDSTYELTTSTTELSDGAALAISGGFIIFFLVFFIAFYALFAFMLGRIFKKAGVEPWIAWVPIYNSWKTFEIGDQKGYWSILMFIPIVNFVAVVFYIIATYKIGLKLGKEGWFVLLSIFVSPLWLAILAFDKSQWNASAGQAGSVIAGGSLPVTNNQTYDNTTPTPISDTQTNATDTQVDQDGTSNDIDNSSYSSSDSSSDSSDS